MGERKALWWLIGILSTSSLSGLAVADGTTTVVINELAWAGSSISAQDEWIELHNFGSSPVDLSGWTITKLVSGEEQPMIILPAGTIIAPSGYFVVANYAADASVLNIAPDLVDTAVTLSNTALKIGLYAGAFGVSELVDTAGDGGVPPAGNNSLKLSMERNIDRVGWHDASNQINLDDGVIDIATPAANNSSADQPPPEITSVAPASASTGDELELEEIIGNNFSTDPAPTIELIRESVTLSADSVSVASSQLIDYARFNITGAQPGDWDVRVVNPDGRAAILPLAVKLTPAQSDYRDIRINEIYPNPKTGDDEFIELYNFGNRTADLSGWTLDDIKDGGSAPFELDGVTISANSFKVLFKDQTKLTLNDADDQVLLIDPAGDIVSKTSYSPAPDGKSWSWLNGGWEWTDRVTKAAANLPHSLAGPVIDPDDEPPSLRSDTPLPPTDLELTELLPNPTDGDEFIEIFNPNSSTVDLGGWRLRDASGRSYIFPDQPITAQAELTTTLPGKSYTAIWQTQSRLQLNNSGGEIVELVDPAGRIVSRVQYPDRAPIGGAYVADGDNWLWSTQPTPGQTNIQSIDTEEVLAEQATPAAEPLPPTGTAGRQWLGVVLLSIVASFIVWWQSIKHHDRQTIYYHRLVRNLQARSTIGR